MGKNLDGKMIYLAGFMGSGKTTVGREISDMMDVPFLDMDSLLEERFGMSISEVFAMFGEAYFRNEEFLMLRSLPTRQHKASDGAPLAVVSCGGGVVLSSENRDFMRKTGIVIHLAASPETVLERLAGDTGRPLLAGKSVDGIRKMQADRSPLYEEVSDYKVITDGKTPAAIASEIISFLLYGSD